MEITERGGSTVETNEETDFTPRGQKQLTAHQHHTAPEIDR